MKEQEWEMEMATMMATMKKKVATMKGMGTRMGCGDKEGCRDGGGHHHEGGGHQEGMKEQTQEMKMAPMMATRKGTATTMKEMATRMG